MSDRLSATDYSARMMSERQLQMSILQYLEINGDRKNCYWFSIPNGGYRPMTTGRRMKQEGLRRGVADLCFMFSGKTCWLELKHGKVPQSDEQKGFEAICERLEHTYRVARSLGEALDILREWGAVK